MKSYGLDANGETLEAVVYDESARGDRYVVAYGMQLDIDTFLELTGPLGDAWPKRDGEYGFWTMNYDPILGREVAEGHYAYEEEREGYDGLEALEL